MNMQSERVELEAIYRQLDRGPKRRLVAFSTVQLLFTQPRRVVNTPYWQQKTIAQRAGVILLGLFELARFRLYQAVQSGSQK